MTTVEIKYLTQPHDGTPGTPWTFIKFRDVMMNNNTPLREELSAAVDALHGEASRLAQRLVRQL